MLTALTVKNYVLIESLTWMPDARFNIITGETGAGKSILLGALGLLAGERADTKTLFNADEKCVIEAVFHVANVNELKNFFTENDLDFEQDCTLRREITPNGKSRAFINDTPVTLEVLQGAAVYLFDIHSQHDTLLLAKSDFQLRLTDAFAQTHHLLADYQNLYTEFTQLNKKLQSLTEYASKSQKELDYDLHSLNELQQAHLQTGEQEELENELAVLENAEEIKIKLNECLQVLSESEASVHTGLSHAISGLLQLQKINPEWENYTNEAKNALAICKDLAKELQRQEERTEANPERAMEIRQRLDTIYRLQKKHAVATIGELLEIKQQLVVKTQGFEDVESQIALIKNDLEVCTAKLQQTARLLSDKRKSIITQLSERIVQLLADLGMPNAHFTIDCSTTAYTATGIDKIQFLFTANKGVAPVPLKNAASGGEFSRLMFALKYIWAEKAALPTLIFDEIDTGISGEISVKMAQIMQQMAAKHQIITITHLHTIAAKGNAHFYVYKQEKDARTTSKLKKLTYDERVAEIAQMISGKNASDTALQSAKELLGYVEL